MQDPLAGGTTSRSGDGRPGVGHRVLRALPVAQALPPHRALPQGPARPPNPCTRHSTDVHRVLQWFGAEAHPPRLSRDDIWSEAQRWMPLVQTRRDSVLHACSEAVGPGSAASVDLQRHRICGQGGLPMRAVTGFRTETLVAVRSSPDTSRVLRDSVKRVEVEGLRCFPFVCHGGLRRSVACAVLLLLVACPAAIIQVYARRTREAAAEGGWSEAQGVAAHRASSRPLLFCAGLCGPSALFGAAYGMRLARDSASTWPRPLVRCGREWLPVGRPPFPLTPPACVAPLALLRATTVGYGWPVDG